MSQSAFGLLVTAVPTLLDDAFVVGIGGVGVGGIVSVIADVVFADVVAL